MSVSLTPINFLKPESDDDVEIPDHVNISNGTWKAITAAAAAYGEDVSVWNGCHDPVRYTPDQLRAIAARIDQLSNAGEWLRWLADNGGAQLS